MRKILLVLGFIAMAMTIALPGYAGARRVAAEPTASPTPVPVEDPAVTKVARQQFISWQAGAINRKLYTSDLRGLITPEKLNETSAQLGQLGAYVSSQYIGPEPLAIGVPDGSKTYLYRMQGTVGAVYMQFTLTPDGKIASLAFRDSYYDFHPTPSPPPTPPPTPEPTEAPAEPYGY